MSELRDRLDALKLRPRAPTLAGHDSQAEAPALSLGEALGGAEHCCEGGSCWCVETRAPRLGWPAAVDTGVGGSAFEPSRAMIVDVETGGFSGAPVFLIGVLLPVELHEGHSRVVQLLARDFPEEQAILRAFAEIARGRDVWVTFNGKSFDQPFLQDRMTVHRIPPCRPREHHDLLHLARRTWKGRVSNCRLVTLQREILGYTRINDIPGRDVPDLFHHFFRTGRAGALRPVLEHNRADLIAAQELLARIVEEVRPGPGVSKPAWPPGDRMSW